MRRLRLVIAIDEIQHWLGGSEKQIALLLRHLPSHGVDAELLAISRSRALEETTISHQCLDLPCKRWLGPWIGDRARQFLRRSQADAVMAFFSLSRNWILRAAALEGTPLRISTRRNFGATEESWVLRGLPRWQRWATHVLCNSLSLAQHTRAVEGESVARLCWLPNIIEAGPGAIRPETEDATIHIAHVGNLRPVKRTEDFLRAAALVADSSRALHFHVVGDGPGRGALEELAAELGLSESLTFHGRVAHVSSLLTRMHVGVLASESEGCSNAILEYMDKGLPVVAAHVDGNVDLVRHGVNGFLVPPRSPGELASALETLCADAELRASMGRASREQILREHAVETTIPKYAGFLRRELEGQEEPEGEALALV